MRVFDCNQDPRSDRQLDYAVDGTHKWTLPGVKCSTCGTTWSTTGIEYPTVDISNEPFAHEYTSDSPIPIEHFETLIAKLRSRFPSALSLQPGTEFGRFVGRASGPFPDFTYPAPWTVLITRHAYALLSAKNVRMPPAVAADLRLPRDQVNDLWELEIQPLASLHPDSFLQGADPCRRCRREGQEVIIPIIDRGSIPTDQDIFRPHNFPTYILATERFKNAVEELSLTGMIFRELVLA